MFEKDTPKATEYIGAAEVLAAEATTVELPPSAMLAGLTVAAACGIEGSMTAGAAANAEVDTVTPAQLAYAEKLRQAGDTNAEIVVKTGSTRSSLYRHLPARPAELVTVAGPPSTGRHEN